MTRPPTYSCREAFSRVDDYVDRELTPEETALVAEHLETCGMCAREFAFEQFVLERARQKLARIDVPESLKDRIARALRPDGEGD
jgi:mycothiol system anti-sigma-R factor